MASSLVGPLRHDTWATLRLIAFVHDLTAEQRIWTAPGTYGSIEQTLGHLVGAESYYVYRLTGERPVTELMPRPTVDLDDLAERVGWLSERLEQLCMRGFDHLALTHPNPGDRRMPTLGHMAAQLLWHGAEHRAQIATILGAHGIEPPDMSGWTYSEERRPTVPAPGVAPPDALPDNPWDTYADAYQRFVRVREQADLMADPFIAAMLASLGDVSGREVLDACCGEGLFSRVLAAKGARVTAIDLSPRLIGMARDRQQQSPAGRYPIDYEVGDLTRALPDIKSRFPLISSHLALNDVRDHRAYARVLMSLAAPGGRLVLGFNNPYSSLVRGHIKDYFENGAVGWYIGMAQRGVKAHYYHRTLEEYLDAFFAAGWHLTNLADVWPGQNDLLPSGTTFPYGLVLTLDLPHP